MVYIYSTIAVWTAFFVLIPVRRWRDYYPVILFSALLGLVCDIYGVAYQQWVYHGPIVGGLSLWANLGIAPAEGGLFIRLYPTGKKWFIQGGYLGAWAFINMVLERLFVAAGWIGYQRWNSGRAFIFYLAFFGLVGLQEYWYNGSGRLRNG